MENSADNKKQTFKQAFIKKLKHLIESPAFGLTIMALILISVLLIIIDSFVVAEQPWLDYIELANSVLTYIFVIELLLRWLVTPTTGRFLSEYWIDILAVAPAIPAFRIFRLGRVIRILRMMRMLRLFRVFSIGSSFQRKFKFLSKLFSNKLSEIGIILSFAVFAVLFGAIGLAQFEVGQTEGINSSSDAFWKALCSLLAGEYADLPVTTGGRIVFIVLMIFEMSLFAMLTGTFSAIMVDKLKETAMHKHTNPEDLDNHVLICGFGQNVVILVKEFLMDPSYEDTEILIVSEHASLNVFEQHNLDTNRISILNEDFTSMSALTKAGVERARLAVITSENNGNRSTHDIDARTILAALTIEKMHPGIHTSAEIYNEEYSSHLKMGGVEDVVIQGEFSSKLLAQIAAHEGILAFFKDLLSRDSGNCLDFIDVDEQIVDESYNNVVTYLHTNDGSTLVGIKPYGKDLLINPKEYRIKKDDKLLVIRPVKRENTEE